MRRCSSINAELKNTAIRIKINNSPYVAYLFQSRNSHGQLRALGVSGIEKKLAENHAKTHESITQVSLSCCSTNFFSDLGV